MSERRARIGESSVNELLAPLEVNEPLYYTLPEFDIRIVFEPIDFVQVNAGINQRMVHFAVEQLVVDSTLPCSKIQNSVPGTPFVQT